jgi:hypothetical protein
MIGVISSSGIPMVNASRQSSAGWVAAEVFDEAIEATEDGMKKSGRESLDFIVDDDRTGDAVEFSAGRGAVGVKRFKELDIGGDDDGCVPVFAGKTVEVLLVVFRAGFGLELRVVLENNFAPDFFGENGKRGAENIGVLADDRGERNDIDDAAMALKMGVAECEK